MLDHIPQFYISSRLLATVRDYAQRDYPHEACGFLLGTARDNAIVVLQVWPAANTAALEKRTRTYAIASYQWIRTEQQAAAQGLAIVGIYHSHPDQSPEISKPDIVALWPQLVYLIVASGTQVRQPLTVWMLDAPTGTARPCALHLVE
ncbi:MAG: Mov34/MPN/PAD-1 family protein [Phycisphaerae bacterium]